ncbi:sialate O-acetylesterase [Aquimarina sp. M1]
MRVLLTTLFILIFSLNCDGQDANFHIYLSFGQSNMEGQGAIEEIDKKGDSNFLVLQALDCPDIGRKKGKWYKATPPICQCTSGLSPVDYFGRTMITKLPDSIKIGVVNIAVGGCDIRLFDKDIYENYTLTYNEEWFTKKVADYNGNPYRYLIEMAKIAQKKGVIKGVLLHQGETNTGDSQWPYYVKKIYSDILKDLSLDPKTTPLLAGEVVSEKNSCCSSMNTIINKLPDIVNTAHIISSKNCSAQDNAHFDSEGYRELGRRYAVKMLSLLSVN